MISIRSRLLVTLLAVVLAAAAVAATVAYRDVRAEAEILFDYQLRQMALSLRNQGFISADEVTALADDGLDFMVQIWAVDGARIYASRPRFVLPAQSILGYSQVTAGGETWRLFTTVARDRVIQVAQPLSVRRDLAAQAALRGALPILALAPLLALAIWWAVGTSLRKLGPVVAEVRRRDAGTLDPVPEAALPREIAPLVYSFNALLLRLRRALDSQRAFVADAAHELRSPLTALSLQVQLLRRSSDDTERAGAIRALGEGLERTRHLVDQLLALARSEDSAGSSEQTVDLAETARLAVADVVPLADAKSVELELEAGEGLTLSGDARALQILVRNLTDNAVRYTPQGGRVRVSLALEGSAPVLKVDDSGPGIPSADRERVFDRFYRGAAAHDEAGSGLGLAIVRRLAERHRASLSLLDSPLGGLRVRVTFAPAGRTRETEHDSTEDG